MIRFGVRIERSCYSFVSILDDRSAGSFGAAAPRGPLYSQRMLTIASRLDAMNRLGRAMADPTRSRILLAFLSGPGYPAELARDLGLTRTNVSNHLACLRGCGIVVAEPEGRRTRYEIADHRLAAALAELLEVTLAVDETVPCPETAGDPQAGPPTGGR